VPFAIETQVGVELDRMVAAGILEPTNESAWATPIVVVKKAGGGIRICGDYKSIVNKAVLPDTYHMPTIDEAFAKLAPANTLSKIDLVKASNQVPICDMTPRLCTITTHQGLYKFKRLPFRINVAAIRFQRLVSELLNGIPEVVALSDILIFGENIDQHNVRLNEVLARLSAAGLRVHGKKCHWSAGSAILGLQGQHFRHPTLT